MQNPELFQHRRARSFLSRSRRRLAGLAHAAGAALSGVAAAGLVLGYVVAVALLYAVVLASPVVFVWLILSLLGSSW